ncbi:hypothetical protein LA66_10000 [Aureimonas altamirensis]|uniref:Uncharacterized protein n=1 Tax=Aureimonas altamirensis TaxID=370622 RepID=A0A0B1Q3B1_9HYPH|nr:hypothetical protein LA66_10000 [Aureimonas altamirensis]
MCDLGDSTRQYIRGRTKHQNHERINLSGTRCTASIWTRDSEKSIAILKFCKNDEGGLSLDFGRAKAQVYGMLTTDRPLSAFFRVCPIAGI